MRLNSFIALAGVTSRRRADELIKANKVTVNGKTGLLNTVVTEADDVRLNGVPLSAQKLHYILLYKPAGYITTLNDPQRRKKVIDLLKITERVVPIGRLDYDTTGLLLLTNDGELANKLMHPSSGVKKTYHAQVKGEITPKKLAKLEKGIQLEDGKTSPAHVRRLPDNKIELILHEGKKHQIKRMLAAVGLPVVKLHRSYYAGLSLYGLKPAQYRELTSDEVSVLKRYT